ncbi:MAG: sterol desaturase family protein [Pseudomonadota bacterium]
MNVRAVRRARLQSNSFSLTRHLCVFATLAGTAAVIAIWLAQPARVWDLWIVPVYVVVANLIEYVMHRLLMHRPIWPRAFYRGHTLGHHRAFHHDSMEIGAWPEMELVMMPWFSLAFFFAAMAPTVAAVARAVGRGAAGLFLLTGVATFVLYEGMHALYHFPLPVLRRLGVLDNRAFRFLYEHHRHHHRLSRMRWTNFNISLPLSDRCFGTLETEAEWQQRQEARSQTAAENAPTAPTDDKHAA